LLTRTVSFGFAATSSAGTSSSVLVDRSSAGVLLLDVCATWRRGRGADEPMSRASPPTRSMSSPPKERDRSTGSSAATSSGKGGLQSPSTDW
jgi:hypothetical protein